jgi:hypothetical protein
LGEAHRKREEEQKPQRGVISITVGAAHGWVKPTEKE